MGRNISGNKSMATSRSVLSTRLPASHEQKTRVLYPVRPHPEQAPWLARYSDSSLP